MHAFSVASRTNILAIILYKWIRAKRRKIKANKLLHLFYTCRYGTVESGCNCAVHLIENFLSTVSEYGCRRFVLFYSDFSTFAKNFLSFFGSCLTHHAHLLLREHLRKGLAFDRPKIRPKRGRSSSIRSFQSSK